MMSPAPDSRVERIETAIGDAGGDAGDGQFWLNLFEKSAKLLVLDPSSPELVERIARADPMFDQLSPFFQRELMFKARRIVAALAAPAGDPS
jgi:hypothetical protein